MRSGMRHQSKLSKKKEKQVRKNVIVVHRFVLDPRAFAAPSGLSRPSRGLSGTHPALGQQGEGTSRPRARQPRVLLLPAPTMASCWCDEGCLVARSA